MHRRHARRCDSCAKHLATRLVLDEGATLPRDFERARPENARAACEATRERERQSGLLAAQLAGNGECYECSFYVRDDIFVVQL